MLQRRGPAAIAATLLLAAVATAQCPMCKQALEGDQSTAGDGWARGFADSIYLMVALPYLLFGATAFLLWRGARRKPDQPIEP